MCLGLPRQLKCVASCPVAMLCVVDLPSLIAYKHLLVLQTRWLLKLQLGTWVQEEEEEERCQRERDTLLPWIACTPLLSQTVVCYMSLWLLMHYVMLHLILCVTSLFFFFSFGYWCNFFVFLSLQTIVFFFGLFFFSQTFTFLLLSKIYIY